MSEKSGRLEELKSRAEKLLREDPLRRQDFSQQESSKLIHDMQVYHAEIEIQNEELRDTQLRLQEALKKFTDLYHHAPVGYFTINHAGLLVEMNETMARVVGKPRDRLLKKPFYQLIHPDDQAIFLGKLKALVAIPDGKQMELRLLDQAGHVRFCLLKAAAGMLENTVLISVMDISERKKVEEKLKLSNKVVETTGDGVLITDIQGTVINVNPSFCTATGYEQHEIIGQNPRVLQSGKQSKHFYEKMWHDINRYGSWQGIVWNKKKNGDLFAEHLTINSILDYRGKVEFYVGVFSDITEQVRYEQHLREVQKMEAVGTMAGGIAHDFNNMLAGIMSATFLMKKHLADAQFITKKIDLIESLGSSAADLIQKLLAFARKSPVDLRPIQAKSFVADVIGMVQPSIPESIKLSYQSDISDHCELNLDKTMFQQMVFNLASNAVYALDHRPDPTISIRVHEVSVSDLPEHVRAHAVHEHYVAFALQDNGCGMNKETLRHAMEPFYTTKGVGKGTGLGLSMVLGGMQMHEGQVDVSSKQNEGTTITLYFPFYSDADQQFSKEIALLSVQEVPQHYGKEFILVVDDNDQLRELMVELLDSIGFHCIEAINGAEGYRQYIKYREKLSLLITDLIMPKVGGTELATSIHAIDRDFPIILLSGYDLNQIEPTVSGEAIQLMHKPFEPVELVSRIEEMIASRGKRNTSHIE